MDGGSSEGIGDGRSIWGRIPSLEKRVKEEIGKMGSQD